jgi:excisionase family DNA binding protein
VSIFETVAIADLNEWRERVNALLVEMAERIERLEKPEASMSVADAAVLLGIKPVTVRAAIKAGTLKAKKQGRDWHITPAAVEAYRAGSLGKPGRPRKQP